MKSKLKSFPRNSLMESLQPMPLIEECYPDDWKKGIRFLVNDFKDLYGNVKKIDGVSNSAALDLDKIMEKRRTQAALRTIESLSMSNAVTLNWLVLNFSPTNYSNIDNYYHIMTAAAIWILDQIFENNTDMSDLYKILPRDEKVLESLYTIDICDTQFSPELIASVEYVLRNRNSDVAPLEDDGMNGKRVFTSNLAAEGKYRADVPSRNNFETLLAMIPQASIDSAVTQFEKCFKLFQNHAINLFSYANENIVESKRKAVNDMHQEINKLRKRALRLMKSTHYDEKLKSEIKLQKPVALMNPLITTQKSEPNPYSSSEIFSPITMNPNCFDNLIVDDVKAILNELAQMEKENEKLEYEYDNAMRFMSSTIDFIKAKGYIGEEEYTQFYSNVDKSIFEPLPFTDPFAMCFALLYLIENGSDIPWLYGSCISMTGEVAGSLPWFHCNYVENEDVFWHEENTEQLAVAENAVSSSKAAEFPDWYSRDYQWKHTDQSDARNLAQIIYEQTGCLMPRNLHRYDKFLPSLGKYGLRQNKALSMLYCMVALGTKRRQFSALNLDEEYMSKYEEKQDTTTTDELNPAELKVEIERLRAEGQQLHSSLYNAEKTNTRLEKKLAMQQEQFEAERRELADLREIVFNLDIEDVEDTVEETQASFPYTVQKKTVVFGGYDTWLKSIKPLFKGDVRFVMGELNFDKAIVRNAEVIWIQIKGLPHAVVCRFINIARQYNKSIRYFTYTSAIKCAEQLLEIDKYD